MTRSEAEALAAVWAQRANRRGGLSSGQADLLSGAAEVRVPTRPVRPPCCPPEGARAAGKRLTSGRAPAKAAGAPVPHQGLEGRPAAGGFQTWQLVLLGPKSSAVAKNTVRHG